MQQVTLVGYGNQGKAWAANLRDSGWSVQLSGRPGGRGEQAASAEGYGWVPAQELRAQKGIISILLPDDIAPAFFAEFLAGGEGRTFAFAHGFAVTYGGLKFSPSDDVILVAPKGIGQKLRENFVAGSGVMGVVGVEQDASGQAWNTVDALATGLGLKRVGLLRSTFAEETKTDLLSEQVILCGAVPRLVQETIAFLEARGVNSELARYECLTELKLIVDMMVEHGVEGMIARVSSAARVGGAMAAEKILPRSELAARTAALWQDIETGTFARNFLAGQKKSGASARDATEASL